MAQVVDQRDLIAGFQPGDLLASERILRFYQNEILRTAFLLTGNADDAIFLARNTFLSYFRQLSRGNVPEDPRYGLLLQLRRSFDGEGVDDLNGARDEPSLAGTVSYDAGEQRYRVEDQRSRVLSTLGLFDHPTLLGLILRDFNALEEEPVCRILDEVPFTLRQQLHPARQRVRSAAGVDANYSVRELLVNAATAAPRPNLWPEVIGPLEEIYAEEDERRQRLTYLAAGLVGLLLVVAGLWLFDLFPFGGDDEGAAALLATPEATPTATVTPEPTATPTLLPELSSFAIPQGDVPGTLLMRLSERVTPGEESTYGLFDPQTETFTPYDVKAFAVPSPDGRLLIGFVEADDDSPNAGSALVALDSATGERVWESDRLRTIYSFVVTNERVYVAFRATTIVDGVQVEQPSVREYALETGELLREWPEIIATLQTADVSSYRIVLFASPANDRLYVGVDEFGSAVNLIAARSLTSFSLPDMTLESSSFQSDSTASEQFPPSFSFWDARVTPDGAFLYRLDAESQVVQFRSANTEEDLDLPLPFVQDPPEHLDLYWIPSNEGRYLYVLSLSRAEVIIVDLLARRVARGFTLDFSEDLLARQQIYLNQRPIGSGYAAGTALSPDGRNLYLIGRDGDGVETSGITGNIEQSYLWAIDLSTWTAAGFREVRGAAFNVSAVDGSLVAMVYDGTTESGQASKLYVLDPDSLDGGEPFEGEGLPDWAQSFYSYALHEFYRFAYGRAPAVDNSAFTDVEIESTLPRITLVTGAGPIPVGKRFDLAVRALNPEDGQLAAEPNPETRFDVDSTIILRLTHETEEVEPVILVANRREPGLYQASTALMAEGSWNADVTITGTAGDSWTRFFDNAIQIVPSWEASDGKRYVLQVASDPDPAEEDRPFTVMVQFVGMDDGAPLPVDVEIFGDFPDQIRIEFESVDGGVANETLERNDDGVYEGERTLRSPGEWNANVVISFPDEEPTRVAVGSVTVVP